MDDIVCYVQISKKKEGKKERKKERKKRKKEGNKMFVKKKEKSKKTITLGESTRVKRHFFQGKREGRKDGRNSFIQSF